MRIFLTGAISFVGSAASHKVMAMVVRHPKPGRALHQVSPIVRNSTGVVE